MDNLNSTFDTSGMTCPRGNMSVDESLIDKESPPPCITLRKPTSQASQSELQVQFQLFQEKMLSMLETWLAKQDTKFNDLQASIQFVSDKYDELNVKTNIVDRRVSALEDQYKLTKNYDPRIKELENKFEIMEQRARHCNIEISNLPERKGEDVFSILYNIGNLINQPVTKQEIVTIHRVPQLNPNNLRPKHIIVKFSSQILRDNFVAAFRMKKGITSEHLKISGSSHNIYVNEHLTLKNKILFRRARDAAKEQGVKFVWIKHGSILVRANDTSPVFAVRSDEDLCKITRHT